MKITTHPVRTGLEVDHVYPFEKGGSNQESTLRTVNNRLCAEEEYGTAFIHSKIEARRAQYGFQFIKQPTNPTASVNAVNEINRH